MAASDGFRLQTSNTGSLHSDLDARGLHPVYVGCDAAVLLDVCP